MDEDSIDIYYFQLEPVSVAFRDEAWTYLNEEAEDQKASINLQQKLEDEFNLPVGITSIGTGAAEPGFLVLIPSAIIRACPGKVEPVF